MFGIDDAIANATKLIDDIVTRVWPDATLIEQEKIKQVTMQIENEYNSLFAQLKINEEEAKNPNIFVSGWRPLCGWIGAGTLLYNGIFLSILNWLCTIFGIPLLPSIPAEAANNILYALLGLGGYRSVEKINKVDTKRVGK